MRSSFLSVVLSLLFLSILSPFIVARSPESTRQILRGLEDSSDSLESASPLPVLTTIPPPPSATSTPSHFPASSLPPSPSVTSTPSGFPPAPTSGLLSPSSDWAIRYFPPNYHLTFNSSFEGVTTRQSWDISSITQKLTSQLSHKEAERQEKRLDRYVEKLNRRLSSHPLGFNHSSNAERSSRGGHHHGDKKHYGELSSFYLRHAQCRACVQSNYDLLFSTSRVSLPSYQPNAIMKYCTLQTPLLPHEQGPSAENPQPLQDWEGACVPATSDCPVNTLDLNILGTSTCANDVAVTKQSCALCVLDGYEWRTHKRAVKGGDNYDGVCAPSSEGRSQAHGAVSILTLDECPSIVASARADQKIQQVKGGFFLFFGFTALLCLCLGLRRCCQVRKARVAARSVALAHIGQAQSGVNIPIAEPVHVISASASQPSSSSYPARVAQAQEQAREVRHQAVAMQEPLLMSSGLNPPFYPQLHNPPPYGYRV